jgi:ferrochelatase
VTTSPSTTAFDAVLLISFGGPKGLADIRPFLANVLKGRQVPPQRIEEVAHHYELFDGVSPLTELTMKQAAGLRARLKQDGPSLPVYVGMRNWHPYLTDTIREMARDGVKRAVGLVLAPHRSHSSCEQYRRNVIEARRELTGSGYPDVQVFYVGDWHTHEGFANAVAGRIRTAFEELPPSAGDRARLVFTAHSIPLSMAQTSPYHDQLKASASLVASKLGQRNWALVFQSRSGRPEDPWLEPDVCDYLRTERTLPLSYVQSAS